MTQYAALIYTRDADWTSPEEAETGKAYAEFGEQQRLRRSAVAPASTRPRPPRPSRVQGGRGGDVVTTDGPFVEAREVLAGFYLIEADDLDAAVAIAAQIPGAWDGAIELRPTLPIGLSVAEASSVLAELVRDEGRRVLATLIRTTGSIAIAEDAVQEAAIAALEHWPRDGIPDNPRAWLTTVARRKAVDTIRREAGRGDKEVRAMDLLGGPADVPDSVVRDDELRLVFTCCHPALSLATQTTLSLTTLCGLSVADTARLMLTTEGGDGSAAHPGEAQDRGRRHPVPDPARRRAARAARRRCDDGLPALHRRGRRRRPARTPAAVRRGDPARPAARRAHAGRVVAAGPARADAADGRAAGDTGRRRR